MQFSLFPSINERSEKNIGIQGYASFLSDRDPVRWSSIRSRIRQISGGLQLESVKPVIVADLFPQIHRELIKLLKSLSKKDWLESTVCSGWTVKDVALHLLGGAIGNLSRRRDGNVSESIEKQDELIIFINDLNQSWVSATRRISARLLIDLLEICGSQMYEYFQGLDPYIMGGPVSWVGPGPAPVWMDLAREYTELWHHQQHIRDAVGKPGLKQPKYFSPVLETFILALPRTYHDVNAKENTSVKVNITGESGGCWSILFNNGVWRLYKDAQEKPTTEVLIDQDIAWRLFTRGINKDSAKEQLTIIGSQKLGLKLIDMVSIIA